MNFVFFFFSIFETISFVDTIYSLRFAKRLMKTIKPNCKCLFVCCYRSRRECRKQNTQCVNNNKSHYLDAPIYVGDSNCRTNMMCSF